MAGSSNFSVIFRLLGKDETAGPFGRLRAGLRGIGQQASVTARALGMHRVTDGLRGVFGAFGALRAQISGVGLAFAGLIGGGTAAGFYAWVTGAADAGDEVAKLGRRVGLTAEQVSGLQYAMQLTGGGTAEEFNTAIRTFAKNIGDAANGTGEAKELFKAMGMSLTDSSGRLKPTSALLDDLANKMAKIKNPTERQTVAMRLFGESGGKMALILEGGAAALAAYTEEGRAYLGMTEQLAAVSEAYKDSQLRVSAAFTFLRNGLAERLLPIFTLLNEKFAGFMRQVAPNLIEKFAGAIGDLATRVSKWFDVTEDGTSQAEKALTSFMGGLKAFGATLSTISDFVGGWGNMLLAVAGIMAAPFLNAVLGVGMAFGKLAMVLAANPVVLIAGAIAGAAYLIYRNWDGIAEWFGGLWEGIKTAFSGGVFGIVKALTGIDMLAIGRGWVDGLWSGVSGMWDSFIAWLQGKIAGLTAILPEFMQARLGLSAVGAGASGDAPGGQSIVGGDRGPIASPQGYQPSAEAQIPPKGEVVVRVVGGGPGTRVETKKAQGMDLTTDADVGFDYTGMAD